MTDLWRVWKRDRKRVEMLRRGLRKRLSAVGCRSCRSVSNDSAEEVDERVISMRPYAAIVRATRRCRPTLHCTDSGILLEKYFDPKTGFLKT